MTVPSLPPPHKPSRKADDNHCGAHPTYQGVKTPRKDCEGCWRVYLSNHFGNRVRPFDEALTIRISDKAEITQFITALKGCIADSGHSGGIEDPAQEHIFLRSGPGRIGP